MPKFAAPAWSRFAPVAIVLAAVAGTALAQNAPPATPAAPGAAPETPAELLKDFIFYVRIDNYDVAAGFGRQILDLKLDPVAFVKVVEDSDQVSRFTQTIPRAMQKPGLEEVAASLYSLYERGKLARARDPEQIKSNIELLTGTVRGRLLAQERLLAAGEYAVPQLLTGLFDRANALRSAECRRVLIDLGRQSIAPLTAALPRVEAAQQEAIVEILGAVPYGTSLPALAELRASTSVASVQEACARAMGAVGGAPGTSAASELYLALGEAYYQERSELTSFPGEDHQLLWSYDPGSGLIPTAIRTEVFHEAMAMGCAEKSLRTDLRRRDSLGLWVAANFKREIETPAGYDNPAYPADRRDAMYFAVASGADILQGVLARAVDTRNTPLARRAIAALERTAGGSTLWESAGDGGARRPLLEALTYPNRRVQYEAALALGAAQPTIAFPGAERVVPILASAIREADDQVAAIVGRDNEVYQVLRGQLEKLGYTVLARANTLEELAALAGDVAAVDLLVASAIPSDRVPEFIDAVRGTARLTATPVVVTSSLEAYTELRRRYDRDLTVAIRQSGIAPDAFAETVKALVQTASGGAISADEARDYSVRSLGTLRDLAISGTSVFTVADAATPLIASLPGSRDAVRIGISDVLSRIPQERAQRALMQAAIDSSGADRVAMLTRVAESAKRFGNLLGQTQIDQLVGLASGKNEIEATAAASLMGALNLPNSRLIPLILNAGSR